MLTGVALIDAMRAADPTAFAWRQPPYEYEHDKMPIDILAGSPALATGHRQRRRAPNRLRRRWPSTHEPFLSAREPYLLYR